MTNQRIKVKKRRDPDRSLVSAMNILIELYPERAAEKLKELGREKTLDKPHQNVVTFTRSG